LSHRFFDFIKIAFYTGQEEENEFAMPCNDKKIHFFDFTQVSFRAGPEAKNKLKIPSFP